MSDWVARFWDWLDSRAVVRRASLALTFWMTYAAFEWAKQFALATKLGGIDAAAIIAAVTAPITVLQGYVFKAYIDGRSE